MTSIGLLADLYHLTVNGDDVSKAITTYADRIAHVQIADAPGRNEPGTGTIPIDQHLGELAAAGYDGWIGWSTSLPARDCRQLRLADRPPTASLTDKELACHE